MSEENQITIKYSHFESLNKSILNLGDQVRDLTAELKKCKDELDRVRHVALSLREAGDEVWYAYRHREPLSDPMSEWAEVRTAVIAPPDVNL